MSGSKSYIHDAEYTEVLSFQIWTKGSNSQLAADQIEDLEDAWRLVDEFGGDDLFQVIDSNGGCHVRIRSTGSAQTTQESTPRDSENPGHPEYYKSNSKREQKDNLKLLLDLFYSPQGDSLRASYTALAMLFVNSYVAGLVGGSVIEGSTGVFRLVGFCLTATHYIHTYKGGRK